MKRRLVKRLISARYLVLAIIAYASLAYVVIPSLWEFVEIRNKATSEQPQITTTSDGHPGDPINVSLIGSEPELINLLKSAGWFPADKLGVNSDLAIAVDTVLDRTYNDAPVSRLFLFGREEDLAFELPVKSHPRHRHHVRFWKSDSTDGAGGLIWLGSASFDDRVGFSHTTGEFTHHISADVDAERDFLAETVRKTGQLASEKLEPGFHDELCGFNGGGDKWTTDGALWQAVIRQQ